MHTTQLSPQHQRTLGAAIARHGFDDTIVNHTHRDTIADVEFQRLRAEYITARNRLREFCNVGGV